MFSRVYSGGVQGIDAYRIEVEADCTGGIGQISIVGLPDASVRESQERVRAAVRACDVHLPTARKWVVNLAPADLRKEGPLLDLPIAVAVLASSCVINPFILGRFWLAGELGLDGSVRGIPGALALAMACKESGAQGIIIPEVNAEEAELVEGLDVWGVSHLKQVIDILSGDETLSPRPKRPRSSIISLLKESESDKLDMRDVKGQRTAKRALCVAAAGKHNILLVGPPGCGKSMLAQRLLSIMPPLEYEEALDLTKLYSVAGLLTERGGIVSGRPFRSPHHSASVSGLIGGGTYPRPGEISLAHLGVLFLDEMIEFPRAHLEALRQPMESGCVTISRAQHTFTYPSSFLLVGACNPCPCGYRGDSYKECTCTTPQAEKYWNKISGPIRDRIDLKINVQRLSQEDLVGKTEGDSSETLYLQVKRAVERQKDRCGGKLIFNSQLSQRQMKKVVRLTDECNRHLLETVHKHGFSARSYDRILRVARTLADLDDEDEIARKHIHEAIFYRSTHNHVDPYARATGSSPYAVV